MSQDPPDHAKKSNAPWVFIVVIVVSALMIVAGIWAVTTGRFAGVTLIVTGLIYGSGSVYWLRRFSRERRGEG